MDAGLATIVVACITTLGGIVVGFMQSFKKEAKEARKENREDHEVVQMQLKMIYLFVVHLYPIKQN
jgi:flagellar basal body-associated protein FliL